MRTVICRCIGFLFPPADQPDGIFVATVLAGFYLISGEFRGRVKRKAAVGNLGVLIVLSTVFIKQHSVLDLIFGVLLGAAVTLLVWLGETIYDRRKKAP